MKIYKSVIVNHSGGIFPIWKEDLEIQKVLKELEEVLSILKSK